VDPSLPSENSFLSPYGNSFLYHIIPRTLTSDV
jgi:hypothetical protein